MSRLLDEPGRSEIAALLRRYVALRLSAFESGGDLAKIEAHDAASEAMHVELWDAMLRAVQPVRTGTIAGLVSEPMARVIALQEERRSARRARVPDEVLGALIVYSLITAYTLGYVMGGIHNRHRIVSTILFALITVSILVTLDLDNPTGGTIRLSPEPLRAAQATLATDFSIAPAAATPVR
jgi:hypothetical protein